MTIHCSIKKLKVLYGNKLPIADQYPIKAISVLTFDIVRFDSRCSCSQAPRSILSLLSLAQK